MITMVCGSWYLFSKSVFSRAFIYRYSSQARQRGSLAVADSLLFSDAYLLGGYV